jgi:hypothetical protein
MYFIDHGAALFFHHNWQTAEQNVSSAFPQTKHHLLLPWANAIEAAAEEAHARLTVEVLSDIMDMVPDEWLAPETMAAKERRTAYLEYLIRRLITSASFEEEAIRAHQRLV